MGRGAAAEGGGRREGAKGRGMKGMRGMRGMREHEKGEGEEEDDDKIFWKSLGICCGASLGPLGGLGRGFLGAF